MDRRVQRGDAQRLPQLEGQVGILSVLLEQFGDRHVLRQTEIHAAQREHETRGFEAFVPGQALCLE